MTRENSPSDNNQNDLLPENPTIIGLATKGDLVSLTFQQFGILDNFLQVLSMQTDSVLNIMQQIKDENIKLGTLIPYTKQDLTEDGQLTDEFKQTKLTQN